MIITIGDGRLRVMSRLTKAGTNSASSSGLNNLWNHIHPFTSQALFRNANAIQQIDRTIFAYSNKLCTHEEF